MTSPTMKPDGPENLQLALGMLSSYLFFLLRRPISNSNTHYLSRRIKGLKSLGTVLASSDSPQIRAIADKLNSLQPANLSTVARDLQVQLVLVHKPGPLPADYVVSNRPPVASLFANAPRILLALGPAIGIGDEMIFYPVPASIKATLGNVHVAVMSGYQGLWDRVRGVDDRIYYSTHRELLEILNSKNENNTEPFDLVIFGDFEKPGLAPLVCLEPQTRRYIEVSLGAQHAAVVDNASRSFRSTSLIPEARISYYAALDRLLDWLGIQRHKVDRYKDVVQYQKSAPLDSIRIFVSPFTSKYNPSLIYWSQMLSLLWLRRSQDQVEFVLDPGTNPATERFSSALAKSAKAQAAPGIRFSLAGQSGRGLPLHGVFTEIERSHAVLCADSFAAHAGPLFGCTTLVVAAPGLENWRTPSSQSYYFDTGQPVAKMAAAMRGILNLTLGREQDEAAVELGSALTEDALRLNQATDRLGVLLRDSRTQVDGELADANAKFVETYKAVIRNLGEWPDECSAICRDVDYERIWRTEPRSDFQGWEWLEHLQTALARWENTNLRKLLHHICARSMAAASP
jgi:hypothetical protein